MTTFRNLLASCLLALVASVTNVALLDAREVEAGPDEVIKVRARLRFATAVVLPQDEHILDWVCGDAEYWSVQGTANLAFVKPTAEGIRTNVTLVTDKGNVYTLLFEETGDTRSEPDLKLFLRPRGATGNHAAALEPLRFEPRGAAAEHERQAERALVRAREAEERARFETKSAVDAFRASYPSKLRFDYELGRKAGGAPFRVQAMWRDDRFSYIRADPEEAPALYESRDGDPSLVPYDFADGLYVTRRLLSDGWLQIGKRKLHFRRMRSNAERSP